MNAALVNAYKSGKLILFAGAGVSAGLGLPSWQGLIDHIAKDLGYEPEIFASYGNSLALAEYYKNEKGDLKALCSWLDKHWHRPGIDISSSEIHRHIALGKFARIYTTNYDRWLELAHDHHQILYDKIASVSDFACANGKNRQIVKFHGDFDDNAPLALDETSFFERLSLDSPLDIKLSNDILGNSVLFIGYSFSDINIRFLLYRLSKMWGTQAKAVNRPESYLFTNRPNPVAERILGQWGIKMLVSENDAPQTSLIDFLRELVDLPT